MKEVKNTSNYYVNSIMEIIIKTLTSSWIPQRNQEEQQLRQEQKQPALRRHGGKIVDRIEADTPGHRYTRHLMTHCKRIYSNMNRNWFRIDKTNTELELN